MRQKLARILVETAVRNTIRDIRQDPERSIRNLVDMALNFAGGRFQQRFLETARHMLEQEDSAYYTLVKDVVNTVQLERLVTFGMNVGYNGCTTGARTIRQIEEAEGFNIPWCLSLLLEESVFQKEKEAYIRLIQQGQELGIYTWQLHIPKVTSQVLELISRFPDSAFALFCLPDSITPQLLTQSESLNNLMYVCIYREETRASCKEICESLRHRGYLYGLYLPYCSTVKPDLKDKAFLAKVLNLNPLFTLFGPGEALDASVQDSIYSQINELRLKQEYPTIFMELLKDNQHVDSIISSEGCSGGFLPSGQFFTLKGPVCQPETNLFYQELRTILKKALPKGKG